MMGQARMADAQFGYEVARSDYRLVNARAATVFNYRSTPAAPVTNPYEQKVNKMPGRHETVSWDLFNWVVTLLLAIIGSLLVFYLYSVREDVKALRTDLSKIATTLQRELSDARVELTKSAGNVEKEVADTNGRLDTTNASLDTIVLELQSIRPRR
jgi:hypothetical protein